MNHRSQLGQLGENIACGYLVENNFKVIERNFRQKWGEIDIIAKAPDKTLVFVEVKTVRGVEKLHMVSEEDVSQISAEDQLTAAKLQKLQRTASLYANHKSELVNDRKGWRIDLLAITIKRDYSEFTKELTIKEKDCVIKHYENI
ncbi:MAG: YraN family protein [Patescibacteria group bacterium]